MKLEDNENPSPSNVWTGAATLGAPSANRLKGNKGMAFIDLDGTLLGPEKKVSSENAQAVERLRKAGFEIVIASGRHHLNIAGLQDKIGPMDWIVSSQGAVVRHVKTGRILHEFTLPADLALELIDFGRARGLSRMVYHRDGVFLEQESKWTEVYAAHSGWIPKFGDLNSLAANGLQKVLLTEASANVAGVEAYLLGKYPGRLYAVEAEKGLLEFLSPRANKAAGAQALIEERGVLRENTVAFGDGNNDVEILEWAGLSAAMGHGHEVAKRAATVVSAPGHPGTAFARGVDAVLEMAGA